jgi:hypothetical protein
MLAGALQACAPTARRLTDEAPMAEPTQKQSDATLTEQARQGLETSESGKARGAPQLDDAQKADPAGAEAAEQEASDGPPGRGVSR